MHFDDTPLGSAERKSVSAQTTYQPQRVENGTSIADLDRLRHTQFSSQIPRFHFTIAFVDGSLKICHQPGKKKSGETTLHQIEKASKDSRLHSAPKSSVLVLGHPDGRFTLEGNGCSIPVSSSR
ncbi:MAG: hypothetical protein WDZ79_02740 [Candidatus Paceibacterota bacterium]